MPDPSASRFGQERLEPLEAVEAEYIVRPEKLAAFGVEGAAGQCDVYGALFLPVRLVLVGPAAAFLPALEVLDVLRVTDWLDRIF